MHLNLLERLSLLKTNGFIKNLFSIKKLINEKKKKRYGRKT